MLTAILVMTGIAIVLGLTLGYAAIRFKVEGDPLVEKIDAILPQTQCGQCGFPGCKPYAEAIANGEAEINQCPPGGMEGIERLAAITGHPVIPLNPDNGIEGPVTVAELNLKFIWDVVSRIKIGDKDVWLENAPHRYEIRYRLHDVVKGSEIMGESVLATEPDLRLAAQAASIDRAASASVRDARPTPGTSRRLRSPASSRARSEKERVSLALARGAATSAESAAIEPATAACCANAGRVARAITSARTSRTAPCLARDMAAGVRRLWRALEFVTRSSLKNHAPIMPVNRDHLVQKKLKRR